MIPYFRRFSVAIKPETIIEQELAFWDGQYEVLCMDIEKGTIKKDVQRKVGLPKPESQPNVAEFDPEEDDIDEEDEEEDNIVDEVITLDYTNVWVFLGNSQNGEFRWFNISDVLFTNILDGSINSEKPPWT